MIRPPMLLRRSNRRRSRRKPSAASWPFLAKLGLAVLIFRSFFFSPFTIPSESMLPQLMNGDYLLASKWPYGYSRHSLPFSAPLIPGRIFADVPDRGDVAIFKHPIDGTDYIKRVIGLPGDRVRLEGGRIVLNSEPLPLEPLGRIAIETSPNTACTGGGRLERDAGRAARPAATSRRPRRCRTGAAIRCSTSAR